MPLNMLHCGFDGRQDGIQSKVYEVDSCDRNYQAPVQDNACVQNMVKDVEQRGFVLTGLAGRENCFGLGLVRHQSPIIAILR